MLQVKKGSHKVFSILECNIKHKNNINKRKHPHLLYLELRVCLNGFWFDIKAGVIILAIDDISSEF